MNKTKTSKTKKMLAGLFVFALIVGIGLMGISSQVSADTNTEDQANNSNWGNWGMGNWNMNWSRDDFIKFHEEMWDFMGRYGMGPGMMGGSFGSWGQNSGNTQTQPSGMNFNREGGNGFSGMGIGGFGNYMAL